MQLIELKNTAAWKSAVDAISSFISEGNFRFTDSGIKFRALDPSQVVLVNFEMDKKFFDKYEVEPSFVGLDVVELSKIMARAQPNDRLSMELSDAELVLKFENELSRSFSLPIIDVSDEEINLPEPKFDASVEINARMLKEALKDASLFGSSVVLKVKPGQFFVEARGTQGQLKAVSKNTKKVSVTCSNEVVSKYSLNFLQNVVKEADPEKKLLLELKSDAMLRVSYRIGDCPIQFHLAHMIL